MTRSQNASQPMPSEGEAMLAPCPFCGEQEAFITTVDQKSDPRTFYRVRCDNCEATSFGCYCMDREGAAREWNTRATPQPRQELESIIDSGIAWGLGVAWDVADETHGELWKRLNARLDAALGAQATASLLFAGTRADALALIEAERHRQVTEEGYDSRHDDAHDNGEIMRAGMCYLGQAHMMDAYGDKSWLAETPMGWPWASRYWKPTSPERDLVKAGALFLAERDRLRRRPNNYHGHVDHKIEVVLRRLCALALPAGDGREATIEECARELETSYPDHAWLNAACAAIRSLSHSRPERAAPEVK